MKEKIPSGIEREHILQALESLNSGVRHDFADSRGYDLLYEGKRYPPKAVVGVAAELITGQQLGPYDFKGGVSSKCFRVLEQNGFEIVIKLQQKENKKQNIWTKEELEGIVLAYVKMLNNEIRGEDFTKSIYYSELADRFGRTPKSIEVRMQNISYVYAMMGRRWVTGLLPAKNVGLNVAKNIETLIREVEGLRLPFIDQRQTSRSELKKIRNLKKPKGIKIPEKSTVEVTQFSRDKDVVDWVLIEAAGTCESCSHDAPFLRFDDTKFLEVHHLRRLADHGSDSITNAVALCPNCHREFHYGKNSQRLRANIYAKVSRLIPE